MTTDHRAYCWGRNVKGQLGIGTDSPEQSLSVIPVPVAGGLQFRQLDAGANHTCGVTTDDRAYCWGSNLAGWLGDGTAYNSRLTPVPVVGGLRFRSVSAADEHTCGVTTDNRAYCWGLDNGHGRLGNPNIVIYLPVTSPLRVAGGLRFRQVSAGNYHTCGITTADRAYCWGTNNYGQLGDSTETGGRNVPVRVAGGRYYRQVDAGIEHTCAVTTNYRAFCWGNGRRGQLGNGKAYLSFWPRRVKGDLSFERVTAGGTHSCAETTTNRAYCWGGMPENYGQLGDGTTSGHLSPVAVVGDLHFLQVHAKGLITCGVTASERAYCWGLNNYGQLGDGTRVNRPIPTPVAGQP